MSSWISVPLAVLADLFWISN